MIWGYHYFRKPPNGHGTMGCVDSWAISRDPCIDLWPLTWLKLMFSNSRVNFPEVLIAVYSLPRIHTQALTYMDLSFLQHDFVRHAFIPHHSLAHVFLCWFPFYGRHVPGLFVHTWHTFNLSQPPLDMILVKMWGDRFTSYVCIVSTSIQSWIVWCACVCLFLGIALRCPFFPQSQAYCTLPKIVYQADGWNVGDPGCWMRSFKRWCLVKMWSTNRDPCLIRIGCTPWLEYSGNI